MGESYKTNGGKFKRLKVKRKNGWKLKDKRLKVRREMTNCWKLKHTWLQVVYIYTVPGAVLHSVQFSPCQPSLHLHSPPVYIMQTKGIKCILNLQMENDQETPNTNKNDQHISVLVNYLFISYPWYSSLFKKWHSG